jgi:hypothetical protein
VITATRVGDNCVWRFTPDLSTFPLDKKVSTFVTSAPGAASLVVSGMRSQAGTTESVTFPRGKVLSGGISQPAPGGLWITQPSSAAPGVAGECAAVVA